MHESHRAETPISALELSGPTASMAPLVQRLKLTLANRSGDADQVLVHEQTLDAKFASNGILRPPLPNALRRAMRDSGIEQLYKHQVEAVELVREGHNAVITSPTASGKSLAFNLPTIERLLLNPGSHALYLYPTKALIADQLRSLKALLRKVDSDLTVGVMTGDTPREERQRMIDDPPSILLANPDILHHSLLPAHRRWRSFMAGLEVVVLDELHAYRGVFGAHVALIVRRLRRVAAGYGSFPAFVAASATIGNAVELAEQVVGLPFRPVQGDSAAVGTRRFVFWRPPLRGSIEANEHESVLDEAAAIFAEALRDGRSGILFGRARVSVERMLLEVRRIVGPRLADKVSAYKSGYSAEEREQIEMALRDGRLRGVVATNALELGIDIGALDVAILAGYPGSVMSFWQQAGRVGRRMDREALIVMVGSDDALDQYHLEHPESFFGQTMEHAVVDPGNPSILLGHLICASQEAGLKPDDLHLFPPEADRLIQRLVGENYLTDGPPWRPLVREYPHSDVNIRGVSRNPYTIHAPHGRLGSAEPPALHRECFPGAVYLHNGRAWRVTSLDDKSKVVQVEQEATDARTDPIVEVNVHPRGEPLATRNIELGERSYKVTVGPLDVKETVVGYREHLRRGGLVTKDLEKPLETIIETIGLWIDLPYSVEADKPSVHAMEHALVNGLPLVLLCDRRDIGSTHDVDEGPLTRIYLYDWTEGGSGLSEKAYHLVEGLLQGGRTLLTDCPCSEGCPNCVQMSGCALANNHLDKLGGLALMQGRSVTTSRSLTRISDDEGNSRPMDPRERKSRLRKIAEDELRHQFGKEVRATIELGALMDLSGEGLVIVQALDGARVQVQPLTGGQNSWVLATDLRRLGG